MRLRLVARDDSAEPLTWDESRALASAQLKWRLCQRETARAAEARREMRKELAIFWACLLLIGAGWVWVAAYVLGWFRA